MDPNSRGGYIMVHLVYCDNTGKKGTRELDIILKKEKTMIIRGAAGRKIPHSRVEQGDILYFMEKGSGIICTKAIVSNVKNYIKLQEDEIERILEENQMYLRLSEKQYTRWHKKCLCLVAFQDVETIEPLLFDHQGNMDDWLIIEKIEDVVKGSSIPYNYERSKLVK